ELPGAGALSARWAVRAARFFVMASMRRVRGDPPGRRTAALAWIAASAFGLLAMTVWWDRRGASGRGSVQVRAPALPGGGALAWVGAVRSARFFVIARVRSTRGDPWGGARGASVWIAGSAFGLLARTGEGGQRKQKRVE